VDTSPQLIQLRCGRCLTPAHSASCYLAPAHSAAPEAGAAAPPSTAPVAGPCNASAQSAVAGCHHAPAGIHPRARSRVHMRRTGGRGETELGTCISIRVGAFWSL